MRSRVNSRPPRHFREALGQMANFLGILQSEWAGAQAFSSFDTFLAPYVFKDQTDFPRIKKDIRSFVYNLNVPLTLGTVSLYQCHNRLDCAARPAGSGPLQRRGTPL